MNLTMKALLANMFAASMTVAVIAFPSPSDMVSAAQSMLSSDATILQQMRHPMPSGAQYDRPLEALLPEGGSLADRVDHCTQLMARAPQPHTVAGCREVVHKAAAYPLPSPYNDLEAGTVQIDERLILASAQICRAAWQKSNTAEFDLRQCLPDRVLLALN